MLASGERTPSFGIILAPLFVRTFQEQMRGREQLAKEEDR
jgi:hypothetical protein